jgi:hypothetical protein
MHNLLKEKLKAYIQQNNPELLIRLQESYSVATYLEDKVSKVMPTVLRLLDENKPGYVIEELAIAELTEELRPSRFGYLQAILEEDFPKEYAAFKKAGVLTYETINLTEVCKDLLDNFPFTEDTEEDRFLRYAVIAQISDYLN